MAVTEQLRELKGTRREDGTSLAYLEPGDYVKRRVPATQPFDRWWVCCPDGGVKPICSEQRVIEHRDGTISVPPGRKAIVSPRGWQGFVRRGVFLTV